MRKLLKPLLPSRASLARHRWLAIFGDTLLHPRLWHLNRHSAAGAVAVGLFCGLIPGPLQMLSAALCCLVLRVNLPLALVTTLYTNPFTIVPLYMAAFGLGKWLLGDEGARFTPPPQMADMAVANWIVALADWLGGLGMTLGVGLLLLACLLATLGYFSVLAAWRAYLIYNWRKRKTSTR
ncbi:MAG: DUF2062 domain-containing protein [Zoogloea sp.]|nr:DUF2062 domain-containing protein [Zoogloea sp.]